MMATNLGPLLNHASLHFILLWLTGREYLDSSLRPSLSRGQTSMKGRQTHLVHHTSPTLIGESAASRAVGQLV